MKYDDEWRKQWSCGTWFVRIIDENRVKLQIINNTLVMQSTIAQSKRDFFVVMV
jgi:hypothetical protein